MGTEKTNDDPDKDLLHLGIQLAATAFLAAVVAAAAYIFKFGSHGFSSDQGVWGQFGDFIGGVVNPSVGLATVFLLLITVILQRKELRNSIAEMQSSNATLAAQNSAIALQSFEQTFFSWLSSYGDLVSSVTTISMQFNTPVTETGRKAMKTIWFEHLAWRLIRKNLLEIAPSGELDAMEKGSLPLHRQEEFAARILTTWEQVYRANNFQLDTMFRTLYRLIRWIDEQPDTLLSNRKKWHYVSIIRAQLSHIELILLFYNGLTERAKKFNSYIDKYALFDNLDDSNDPSIRFIKMSVSCPYQASAFNSDQARDLSVASV